MAHSLGYLMLAVDELINSFDKNESDEIQEDKFYNLCAIAEGFKSELEFQKYLGQLIQIQNQPQKNQNKLGTQNKKYLLAQMVKLHIIKLNAEMEAKHSRFNFNSGMHIKSPMISRKRPNSPLSSPSPETIVEEEINFEEFSKLTDF
jgi:hypothetical protein